MKMLKNVIEYKKNIIKIFVSIFFLFYIYSFLMRSFVSVDTPFYTLIGRSIVYDHVLPYKYIFDHKPFFNFVLYGIWDAIIPVKTGMFTVLALCCAFFTARLGAAIWNVKWFNIFIISVTTGSAFEMLSGNTEVIQTLFQILILFLLRSPSYLALASAGVLTALAFNVNYLTAICLFFPVMFLLFVQRRPIRDTIIFSIGVLVGLVLLFSPYWLYDTHSLLEYFKQQKQFLSGYNQGLKSRVLTLLKLTFYVMFFLPVIYVWAKNNIFDKRVKSDNIVLGLWFVSALVTSCLSGHPFNHYFSLWFVPVVIMICEVYKFNAKGFSKIFIPIVGLTLFSTIDVTINNFVKYRNISRIDYSKMSQITAGAPVLNIRAWEVHYYMANMRNADPYLFRDHVDIAFGHNAVQRYMQDLLQKPSSIISVYNGCNNGQIEQPICAYIQNHYDKVYSVKIVKVSGKINPYSFDLYKIKP
ncbi:hypothetical protein [Acetobacter orientalis]